MTYICCPDPGTFASLIPHIVRQIEERGFALLEAWDSKPETFKYMAQHFGQLQHHIRGDEDGIVSVAYEKSWSSSLSQDEASSIQQEEFQSYSADYVSHQIMLIDNRRVLHGRSIYQVYEGRNVRFHRRLWIGNAQPIVFKSSSRENITHRRAWDCYQNYRYLPNPLETNIRSISCGIRLDAGDRQKLKTILSNAESLVV